MSYAANDRNQECDMDNEMCVYLPSKRDNWNVIYSPHTVQMKKKKKNHFHQLIEPEKNDIFIRNESNLLTRCPFVLSCSGKHILHTSQWKKLFRPPIRQIPHPLQWYWSLSSSSNRLQIKHVYCTYIEKKTGEKKTNRQKLGWTWEWQITKRYSFGCHISSYHDWITTTKIVVIVCHFTSPFFLVVVVVVISPKIGLPFRSGHHISRIQLGLFAVYHNLCKLIPLMFFYRSDDPRFHHDSIDNCRIFHSTVSKYCKN